MCFGEMFGLMYFFYIFLFFCIYDIDGKIKVIEVIF